MEIDIHSGEVVTAWPEGGSYPGFIFSQADSAKQAEDALREAHKEINIVLAPKFNTRIGT